MRESQIETYLRERVEAIGGLCYKFVSPGRKNVPDRIVLIGSDMGLTPTKTVFVELKAPGKKPTPGQLREHERLHELGFRVEVIDTKEGVDAFMASL